MRAIIPAMAAAAAAGLAACASPPQTGPAAYEQALGQWQGAPEDLLVQRWGPPQSQEQIGAGKWVTYVTRTAGAAPGPTVSFSIGGFGFGGGRRSGVGVGGGVGTTLPAGPPAAAPTCTTRFLIEDGKVSTWSFDGACGTAG
jgi:hypothetical protein